MNSEWSQVANPAMVDRAVAAAAPLTPVCRGQQQKRKSPKQFRACLGEGWVIVESITELLDEEIFTTKGVTGNLPFSAFWKNQHIQEILVLSFQNWFKNLHYFTRKWLVALHFNNSHVRSCTETDKSLQLRTPPSTGWLHPVWLRLQRGKHPGPATPKPQGLSNDFRAT